MYLPYLKLYAQRAFLLPDRVTSMNRTYDCRLWRIHCPDHRGV